MYEPVGYNIKVVDLYFRSIFNLNENHQLTVICV